MEAIFTKTILEEAQSRMETARARLHAEVERIDMERAICAQTHDLCVNAMELLRRPLSDWKSPIEDLGKYGGVFFFINHVGKAIIAKEMITEEGEEHLWGKELSVAPLASVRCEACPECKKEKILPVVGIYNRRHGERGYFIGWKRGLWVACPDCNCSQKVGEVEKCDAPL